VLLIEMPSASSSSPSAIPFDQILRERLFELGIEEAELVRRYVTHLQVDANRRRSIPIRTLRGEVEPTLATALDLLHPAVLQGELLIQWGDDELHVVSEAETLSTVLRERMVRLGLEPAAPSDQAEVTRRYLIVRYGDHNRAPWGYIKTIQQHLGEEPNPRLQTLIQVVQALGGQVLVRWQVTVRKQLPAEELPESLREKPITPVFLEYQEWSTPQPLSAK